MSYTPVSFGNFGGGLNLRDKEDAVSETEAIDDLNVVFTDRGSVKQRDGYTALTGSGLTNAVESIEPFYTTSGTKQVLCGCGTRLEAVNTSGTVVASATGLTSGGIWDFARFGSPGNEVAYAANANDTIRKWSGSAWSAPASMPKAGSIAVLAVDQGNRLVAGRFAVTNGGPDGSASSSNPSRVYLSDPGDPETWGTNNYIDFTPGDGENIMAVYAWRELLFVFKETKFFVIFGTTTDSTGQPIFNYRTVDTGVGLASTRAITGAADAVYFMSRRGVYRTSGNAPELVSGPIDPIWLGGASSYYTGGVIAHANITNCAMGTVNQRVYLGFPTSSANNRTLVYDTNYDWWTLWDTPAACINSFRVGDAEELVFGDASGSKKIMRHSSSYTNDNGSAITSRWRSGWFDYQISVEKTIRESKAWGKGTVGCSIAADFDTSVGTSDTLTFTTSLTEVLKPRAIRGTVFSTSFANSTLDNAWAVYRLAHHLREQRVPQVSVT